MTPGAEQVRRLRVGLAATFWVTLLSGLIWGIAGAVSGGTMGLIATGLQLLAARVMRRTGITPSVDHLAVYALGMFLRAMGVVALYALVTLAPAWYQPGPCAVGYLGAVLPLLYVETRLSR